KKNTMKLTSRPELFAFEGISMTHYFTVKNFQARTDDILIATYPKAGESTLQTPSQFLLNIKSLPTYTPKYFSPSLFQDKPPGTSLFDQLTLAVEIIPKLLRISLRRSTSLSRNAKDNAVSYFHFDRMNMGEPEPGDWNTYLQTFMEGKKVFGPWYDHVSGWWEKEQTYSNLIYMFYENLVEDTGREVERLCSFLGLSISAEQREKITKGVQFDAMKQNKMTNYSTVPVMDFKISPFMRKGKVGDWKNNFTVAQNEQFDEVYKEKMKNTVKFRTEI
uniref:Sulfotransferase n=1 Tax=Sinocyclocheilus rhinocerous TaxID=307959 RepID=A0A673FIX0_9TELE